MSEINDDWDILETADHRITIEKTADRLEPLAQEYTEVKAQYDELGVRLEQLEAEIAHLFPEEAGEQTQSTRMFDVTVSRTERWTWDKEALEREFSSGEVPDYVKRSLTVDKRKFQKLSAWEQERLKYALTRKLDKPKVKVTENV